MVDSKMTYVSISYQVNKSDVHAMLNQLGDNFKATWCHLLMIDYAYHNLDDDYDGGLSFFDRLNKKIGRFNENWDIEGFKTIVRNSNNPVDVYEDIVKYLLEDQSNIDYYGI